jgi:dTDP-4-dehydrorhamnose reductase
MAQAALKSVWIVGGTGMLGSDLTRRFSAEPSIKVLSTGSRDIDVTRIETAAQFLREHHPSVVINASAYTNVDLAETELVRASELNAVAPRTLAVLCDEFKIPFVHYSTDQVFNGTGTRAWEEEDPTYPLNHYARTKWEGEQSALAYSRALVFRVQWLYGEKKDRFTILKDKETFTPFVDQFGAPTWTADIARITHEAITKGLSGLFHLSYDDFGSWFDVYQFVVDTKRYSTKLSPKLTDEVKLPAERPKNCRLANRKLRAALGVASLGKWSERLHAFLEQRV